LFHDDHDIDLTTDIVRGWGILHNHISSEKQQKGQKQVPSQKRCKAHSNNQTMNTSSQKYIEKRLFIFWQALSLPDCSFHASKIAKQFVDIQFISHQAKQATNVNAIVKLQQHVRRSQTITRKFRRLEFSYWIKKCRSERRVMSSIVCAFVSITALFSLGLCLLTAATFSKEEAILWMVEVVESLLMQILLTDFVVKLTVTTMQVLIAIVMLKMDSNRRRLLTQDKQKLNLEKNERIIRKVSSNCVIDITHQQQHILGTIGDKM